MHTCSLHGNLWTEELAAKLAPYAISHREHTVVTEM